MVIIPRPSLPLLVGALLLLGGAPLLVGGTPVPLGGAPVQVGGPPVQLGGPQAPLGSPPVQAGGAPGFAAAQQSPARRVEAAPPPATTDPLQAAEPEPRFTWPLSPVPQVTRPFQRPETDYGPGHRGVDLAAAPGQQVLAAGPGVVVFSGQVAGQGVISIDHDGGLRTTYEPVTPTVPTGTQVFAGQPIGTVNPGHLGCPVEACLHWGVRRGDEYLNPLALIRTEAVIRLKPWEPP
ncbi:hypothetical protein GCM10017788_11970 [Amycolatopsis acidiphila]|nr:hypothetical protein GCM10017788_11970 [Amycolatopsis acidiphila]